MIHVSKYCDQCGTCLAVCPANAMMLGEFKVEIDHNLCTDCELCVKICPLAALEVKND